MTLPPGLRHETVSEAQIQMNWRLFGWIFAVLVAVFVVLGGLMLPERPLDGIGWLYLAGLSVAFALLLALAMAGLYAALLKWRNGDFRRADLIPPLIYGAVLVAWCGLMLLAPRVAGALDLAFWAIVIVLATAYGIGAWKARRKH